MCCRALLATVSDHSDAVHPFEVSVSAADDRKRATATRRGSCPDMAGRHDAIDRTFGGHSPALGVRPSCPCPTVDRCRRSCTPRCSAASCVKAAGRSRRRARRSSEPPARWVRTQPCRFASSADGWTVGLAGPVRLPGAWRRGSGTARLTSCLGRRRKGREPAGRMGWCQLRIVGQRPRLARATWRRTIAWHLNSLHPLPFRHRLSWAAAPSQRTRRLMT